MEQAFVLPIPKSNRRTEVEETPLDFLVESKIWQQKLDRIYEGKLPFNEVFQKITKPSHPALRLVTSLDGQTILHLAVILNELESIKSLINLKPHLKFKSNSFGLTPYELSLFLPRKEITSFLHAPVSASFCSQPNVTIPNCEESAHFKEIEFLSQPVFENEQIMRKVLMQSKKVKEEDRIPNERIWMGVYFDEEIAKGSCPSVSIRYINEKIKFGVFADKRIPPCAFVGEYTGVIQERKKKELKNKVYSLRYPVWDEKRCHFVVNAEKKGNFTRFINHSANPNLGLQSVYWRGMPRMIFISLKDIAKDSQLTFNYGSLFWKEQNQTPLLFQ